MATANPRARRSRAVSKYFSIHSVRPGNMHTVPRRPAGGSQRAKRSDTPSGVLSVPVTTLSGTGFAGMETSFIGKSATGKSWLRSWLIARARRFDGGRRHGRKRVETAAPRDQIEHSSTTGKTAMSFRITGLPAERFAHLFALSDAELSVHG